MLKLLGRRDSTNVQKVLWCLGELGLPFEREDYGGAFGGTTEPAYLRLNPNATVPTLRDGELALWESNTILRYLCNAYGPTSWYPREAAERALTERWMDWQLAVLSPALTPLFVGLVREGRPPAELEEARGRTAAKLAILDAALGGREYLGGAAPSIAEIALGPSVHRWFGFPIRREPMANLRAWYERLAARPAYREHVMMAGD